MVYAFKKKRIYCFSSFYFAHKKNLFFKITTSIFQSNFFKKIKKHFYLFFIYQYYGVRISKNIFIALEVFFAHKKVFFFKYQHIFFNQFFSKKSKNYFTYLWFIRVMVYEFKKRVFITLIGFILHIKKQIIFQNINIFFQSFFY